MKQAEDNTEQDVAALREQMDQLGADLAAVTRTLENLVGNVRTDTVEKVKDAASDARARARRAGEAVAAEIEERPIMSLILAFLAGLVLGALFGRQK